jgi:hypothetical protein
MPDGGGVLLRHRRATPSSGEVEGSERPHLRPASQPTSSHRGRRDACSRAAHARPSPETPRQRRLSLRQTTENAENADWRFAPGSPAHPFREFRVLPRLPRSAVSEAPRRSPQDQAAFRIFRGSEYGAAAPYSATNRAACSLTTGGAITIAVAKASADTAKNAAAASTGQSRSRGAGGASSARACATATMSRAEALLAMDARVAGVGPPANRQAWRTPSQRLERAHDPGHR